MTIPDARVGALRILALFTRARRIHAAQTPMTFAKAHGVAVQSVRQAEAERLPDIGSDLITLLTLTDLRNRREGSDLRGLWLERQPERPLDDAA